MNFKLILKTIFLIVILLLLVLMGVNNGDSVSFYLPPLVKRVTLKAAIMYFAFFAVGFISGTILTAGGGKKPSSPKPGKPS